MKKTVFLSLFLLIILTACVDKKVQITSENTLNKEINSQIIIESEKNDSLITGFTINENGIIYTISNSNEQFSEINIINENGSVIETISSPELTGVTNITYYENALYFSCIEPKEEKVVPSIYKLDLTDKSVEKLFEFEDYSDVIKIKVVDNKIFVLGLNPDNLNAVTDVLDYASKGEELSYFNLETKELVIFYPQGGINFAVTAEKNIKIYGHDGESFFFEDYNIKNDSFSNKKHVDLGTIKHLEIYSENRFVYDNSNGVFVGDFASDGNINMKKDNLNGVLGLQFSANNLYLLENNETTNLQKLDFSEYATRVIDTEINILQPYDKLQEPINLSEHSVKFTISGFGNYALTVLSLDPTADIFYAKSIEPYSAPMRDEGAFYPLNAIPFVSEYINALHPNIKEVAIKESGEIWMIPIFFSSSYLVYNQDVLSEFDITFFEDMNVKEYIASVVKLYENDYHFYNVFYIPLMYELVYDYVVREKTFDTAEFRELATFIKEDILGNLKAVDMQDEFWALPVNEQDMGKLAFAPMSKLEDLTIFIEQGIENISIMKEPKYFENSENYGEITFLCVNPNSDNLENTLKYISDYCEYMLLDESGSSTINSLKQNNSHMFVDNPYAKDNPYSDEISEIVSSLEITFSMPREVYQDDFAKYLNNEINLEEFISEAQRKLHAYFNE